MHHIGSRQRALSLTTILRISLSMQGSATINEKQKYQIMAFRDK